MSCQNSAPTPTGDFLVPRKQYRWLVGVRIYSQIDKDHFP